MRTAMLTCSTYVLLCFLLLSRPFYLEGHIYGLIACVYVSLYVLREINFHTDKKRRKRGFKR